MCQGLNSHYFHIIGDGHQPNSRGLYTHYKDSYKRWDDHPQYSDFWPWHIWTKTSHRQEERWNGPLLRWCCLPGALRVFWEGGPWKTEVFLNGNVGISLKQSRLHVNWSLSGCCTNQGSVTMEMNKFSFGLTLIACPCLFYYWQPIRG